MQFLVKNVRDCFKNIKCIVLPRYFSRDFILLNLPLTLMVIYMGVSYLLSIIYDYIISQVWEIRNWK